MSQLDASKITERQKWKATIRQTGTDWRKTKPLEKIRWIAKRYWISQLNRPPTLQIGGWIFFLGPSPGVARALKTSWTDPDKGWRGKHRQGGELAVRKKSIGVPASSFHLYRAVDFRAEKKEKRSSVRVVWKLRGGGVYSSTGKENSVRVVLMAVVVALKAKQQSSDILGRLRKHGRAGEC